MKHEDLDQAIDRAVRDLMAVDPQPGLRERVRARLEVRQRPLFAPLRLAGLTACAAAIALLVWMFAPRPVERVPDATVARTSPVQPMPQRATQDVARPQETGNRTGNPGTREPGTAPDRPVRAASIDISELPEEEPIAIEEMHAIVPLAVASLQPEPIAATSEIVVAPLHVEQIEIAPLSSPR